MKIYGFMICQNGVSEILRCIESVVPVVDEYFIMDGGSTDGTWELLNKYKDVYNLTLFQHPYDDQGAQRNRLLSKIPKHSWIVGPDQDCQLNHKASLGLREYIKSFGSFSYEEKTRQLPLTVAIKSINLVHDLFHYNANKVHYFATQVFYNDRNLHFTPGYHTTICYFDTEHGVNPEKAPDDWIIKHYAYLNPERIKNYNVGREYCQDEWNPDNWKVTNLPNEWL